MTPKPMYEELKKLIKGKWWTTAALTTGDDGTATGRGFLGEYKVTVTVPGRRAAREIVYPRRRQGQPRGNPFVGGFATGRPDRDPASR